MDPPPKKHLILLDKVSKALKRNSEDVCSFKNMCQAEGIRPGVLERNGVRELLTILEHRRVITPGKYDKLLQILVDIGRADLAKEYFPEEEVPVSSWQPSPDAHEGNIVSDADLSFLASNMGEEWPRVGMECLDITRSEIYQCKEDNKNSVVGAITDMLNKWKHKQGGSATYSNLFSKLEEATFFDRSILDELKDVEQN